ncbi:PAS domain-containing protein [Hymenobacter coccineus]|uniref:PAS domain-containing protein n=1 Tax=Hymenobacter coccineus TaxID=1908235 RepID=UPI0009F580D1|nr:PAS domain-containing protein [Hymenobacter coccineus]
MIDYPAAPSAAEEMAPLGQELYARQKADNRVLDFIQEASLDGLWYWDLNDPANKWANAKFWRTVGYENQAGLDPAAGAHWLAAVGPDDLAATVDYIEGCIADHSFSFDQLVRCRHQNGATLWLHCWGLVLRNETGQPHRFLGVLVDLTRQRNEEVTAQEVAGHYGAILATSRCTSSPPMPTAITPTRTTSFTSGSAWIAKLWAPIRCSALWRRTGPSAWPR